MSRTAFVLSPVLVVATVAAGCGEPMKQPQLIEETRVIGARAEVEGDAGRAWPRPDEGVTVRWLVAHPAEPMPVSWAFAACPAEDVAFGVPKCAASPWATTRQGDPSFAEPSVEFVVPAEFADYGVAEIAVAGVVCTEGTPTLADSLEASGCEGGQGQRVSFTFGVQLGEVGNRNPDLASAPFELDGDEWVFDGEPSTACRDTPAVPMVAAATDHVLAFELSDSDREPLEVEHDFDEATEALQISHFATGGDLERAYSVVEGELPNRVEVAWKAPKEVSAAGQLVRFYFVVRDSRGGADWDARAVCVTP